MIAKLQAILSDITDRRRRQRLHLGLMVVWCASLVLAALLWKSGMSRETLLRLVVPSALLASAGVYLWSRRVTKDPRRIAKDIESQNPELKTALLAALDQKIEGEPTYLQSRVILEALVSANRDGWLDRLPEARLNVFKWLQIAGFALLFFAVTLFFKREVVATVHSPAEGITATAVEGMEFTVEPGDVEIERGSPLTVQARFEKGLPEGVVLEVIRESGAREELPMSRPFTDPVFHARVAAVDEPVSYRVIAGRKESASYQVRLFDVPALKKVAAVLHAPAHLGQQPEALGDVRKIHGVEGSRLELSLVANLPGLSVSLAAKDKEAVILAPKEGEAATYATSLPLHDSVRYEMILADASGRRNGKKDILEIKVTKNKAPVVQVVLPRKNDKATAIQEVRLEARIEDDTGVLAHGLRYTLDGRDWHEVPGKNEPGVTAPVISEVVDLEAIGAKAKDILMWNAWAEDMGPDGKVRRVNGDIHLVRVRDFDEEFYQQAAPPGGGGKNPASDLVKVQTQILNGTWAVRREHAEISRTAPEPKELETLLKSQETAVEMSRELEKEIKEPALREIVANARLAMLDAIVHLKKAYDQTTAEPLGDAIMHEQSALRYLHQLASSKTMIMTGAQGAGEPQDQEDKPKEDLDLKKMENPYQSEKSAKPEAGQEAREAMEVLQRLADLAKRQRDLNEEIKELQMALKDADTPEKKAELERRLKQLRDQQRELMEDMDRLKEKTSESAGKTAAKEQEKALEEASKKASQADENLQKGKLGEALAAGRRTQDSLEKMEEDLRESGAAKLGEQLRELRQEACELDRAQKELAEKPPAPENGEAPKGGPPRLGGTQKADAADPIQKQKEGLDQLMEGMRKAAENAEQAQPLVANDLAEALRHADQGGVAEALDEMQKAAGAEEAASREAAKSAEEGISKLTGEVEKAAERILGNEAKALRYAREELEKLSSEMAGNGKPSEAGKAEGGEGKEPGEGKGEGEQADAGKPGEGEGKEPGEGKGQQADAGKGEGKEGEGKQSGEGKGAGQGKGESDETAQGGKGAGEGEASPQNGDGEGTGGREQQAGSNRDGRGIGGRVITSDEFREWSDRLHDLEAVIDDPQARSAVARAVKTSRDLRKDFKRHSKEPGEADVRSGVIDPLAEAVRALDVRLRELNKENPLAPIGRDPVPDRYSEVVRRYFEELGK